MSDTAQMTPRKALARALHARLCRCGKTNDADDERADAILAALPPGAAIVTEESLARALHGWGFDCTEHVIRDDVVEPTVAQRRAANAIIEEVRRG